MSVHIAVVVSSDNLKEDSQTLNALKRPLLTNKRYAGVEVTLVAYDAPNDWNRFTHILLVAGLSYATSHEKFLTWLNNLPENVSKRVFNPPRVINWNINKSYLKNFRAKGIQIPPTVFILPGETIAFEEVLSALNDDEDPLKSIVVKNCVDAGGHSAYKLNLNSTDAKEAFQKALTAAQHGLMVQKFLPAVKSEGEWGLVYIDRKLSHAVIKTPSNEGFKVQYRFGGVFKKVELSNVPCDIKKFGDNVISAAQEENLLYARVDIVRNTSGQPCLMELEAFEPCLFLDTQDLGENLLNAILRY